MLFHRDTQEDRQCYSAIGGLDRQFALAFIVADERDVIRLRTNCTTATLVLGFWPQPIWALLK